MSTIGNLFVGILGLIGVAILVTGIVEGSSGTIIAGCFWMGFAALVWFIGFKKDKADEAKNAMISKFAELRSRPESIEPPTYETIETIDAVPTPRERRRQLMEEKRELLLEEELEDEVQELEERRRARQLRRGEDRRRLGSG